MLTSGVNDRIYLDVASSQEETMTCALWRKDKGTCRGCLTLCNGSCCGEEDLSVGGRSGSIGTCDVCKKPGWNDDVILKGLLYHACSEMCKRTLREGRHVVF